MEIIILSLLIVLIIISALILKSKKNVESLDENRELQKNIIQKEFSERIELLLDPQTCGPLLISCNPIYEKYLSENWYKIGEVL